MPADAVRPVSSKIRARISAAVAIGLVERERLDEGGVIGEDRANLMRHRPIDLEPWRHEHQVRAFAKRRARRHRRAYAEGPRLIARRDDDAPPRGIADCDRTASQGWIIALLDRRVEG